MKPSHIHAHEAVIENEFWYGDEGAWLAKFPADRAARAQDEILEILWHSAKWGKKPGDLHDHRAYQRLAGKLERCRPDLRCGSQACPMCARAFQRAKTACQQRLLEDLRKRRPDRRVYMITVIPDRWTFTLDQLDQFDVRKAQRWFKDVLTRAGVNRVLVGGADLSWENTFYQLHWHVAAITGNRKALSKRLTRGFGKRTVLLCPVQVKKTKDLKFVEYANKTVKLPELLRRSRRVLPDLLLALDRDDPLDFVMLVRCRLGTSAGGLRLTPINKK